MVWVILSIIALTVGQAFLCGFGIGLFLASIGRLLFSLRQFGSVIPYKICMGFEAANLFFVFMGIVFSKGGVDWPRVAFSIVFAAVIGIIYLVDDRFYLYVVVDANDEEDSHGEAHKH